MRRIIRYRRDATPVLLHACERLARRDVMRGGKGTSREEGPRETSSRRIWPHVCVRVCVRVCHRRARERFMYSRRARRRCPRLFLLDLSRPCRGRVACCSAHLPAKILLVFQAQSCSAKEEASPHVCARGDVYVG